MGNSEQSCRSPAASHTVPEAKAKAHSFLDGQQWDEEGQEEAGHSQSEVTLGDEAPGTRLLMLVKSKNTHRIDLRNFTRFSVEMVNPLRSQGS